MWKKKLSMKRSVHPQLNIYKRRQDLSIYLIVTTVFLSLSLTPSSIFRLKKEDTKGNSEDDS
jgi:hypothetical protein